MALVALANKIITLETKKSNKAKAKKAKKVEKAVVRGGDDEGGSGSDDDSASVVSAASNLGVDKRRTAKAKQPVFCGGGGGNRREVESLIGAVLDERDRLRARVISAEKQVAAGARQVDDLQERVGVLERMRDQQQEQIASMQEESA
jgi:hypothetical protein